MRRISSRKRYIAAVADAARSKVRRRGTRGLNIAPASVEALREARSEDPTRGVRAARRARRCGKTKTDGRKCAAPAVRGATRCRWHGGLRQVPDHPGNMRRWFSGQFYRQEAIRAAHATWSRMSSETRRTVLEAVPERHRDDVLVLVEGAEALENMLLDRGHAWRRFILRLRGS